jgi:uncharacterized small protein (DUF1192 family)
MRKAKNPLNLSILMILVLRTLDKYISELKDEIDRVNMEKIKKKKLISEAENIFK